MSEIAGVIASLESNEEEGYEGMSPTELQRHWSKEKAASDKRLRKFLKQGTNVVKRFLDERGGGSGDFNLSSEGSATTKLNLFHQNISTMMAMLYGSTPQIEVSREHQDPDDDIARVASILYQRMLETDVYESGADLSTTLKAALQDRLLPGLGTGRVRYGMETIEQETIDELTGEAIITEELSDEWCKVEYVHWQDFRWGWGRTWTEIPWLAYRAWMTKEEAAERFDPMIAKELEYKNQTPSGADHKDQISDPDQKNNTQKAEIWEIWCKTTGKVYWWSEGAPQILDQQEDPLELQGFYPSPLPMAANLTTTLFLPRADFVINQDLYNEIDILQTRISIITNAIKVVGVYDKAAGDSVARMLQEGVENDLIPVDNWAMFAEKGGLKGQIDWFPVETIVAVLQTLGTIQKEKIGQLNEVTGMSEIMRGGAGGQYTAASSNQMAAKMGSIRIQALQDQFARFASDLDALKAEVISKHFSPESIMLQSSATFLPEADKPKVEAAIQLMQSEDVKWRVDIRPETIAMVDYAQLKQERTEFLTAMATYIQSAQAAAKQIPNSLPVLLELMKWGMAGFKGSNYLEGIMDQAIEQALNAPPEDPNANQNQQMQMQQQLLQMQIQGEMQKIQTKTAADMQVMQAKAQAEIQKIQTDHQAKMEQQAAKNAGDIEKIMADLRADLQVINAKLDSDIQTERSQAVNAAAEAEVNHENSITEAMVEHENTLTEMDLEHDYATVETELQRRDREE